MKETLELALMCLTVFVVILQIIALIYLMISNHKRTKEEKKFWREANEHSNELYKDLKAMTNNTIEENNSENKQ